jgi:ATP-dependent Clp protease protease subunit
MRNASETCAGPVPTVVDPTGRGERVQDIFSRLLEQRIVFVSGPIDDSMSTLIVAQLRYLEAEDPERAISMHINSRGGEMTAGLSIYDVMQFIRPPVATLCIGEASSAGALLLTGGTKGMRRALPHSRIMVHQPSGGFEGRASDVMSHARETQALKDRLNRIYAEHTGQSPEAVAAALERDRFMTAEDARDWGLIDAVLTRRDLEAMKAS